MEYMAVGYSLSHYLLLLLGIMIDTWSDIHVIEYFTIFHTFIQSLIIIYQKVKVVRLTINYILLKPYIKETKCAV